MHEQNEINFGTQLIYVVQKDESQLITKLISGVKIVSMDIFGI